MKNISRRVFIKGMAVAAAATAASTVLTGCKFPGTEAPVVEEPTNSNVLSFVDPDDKNVTMTITAMELFKGNEGIGKDTVSVKIKFENNTGDDINVGTSAKGDEGTYCVVLKAYSDNLTGESYTLQGGDVTIVNKAADVRYVVLNVKDKTSVSVKATVYKMLANSVTREMASQTFTYTL